jgi:hypothetical protein
MPYILGRDLATKKSSPRLRSLQIKVGFTGTLWWHFIDEFRLLVIAPGNPIPEGLHSSGVGDIAGPFLKCADENAVQPHDRTRMLRVDAKCESTVSISSAMRCRTRGDVLFAGFRREVNPGPRERLAVQSDLTRYRGQSIGLLPTAKGGQRYQKKK